MAHLHCHHSVVVKGPLGRELHQRQIRLHNVNFKNQGTRFKNNGYGFVRCCSSPVSTSAGQHVRFMEEKKPALEFGYLVSDVNWNVRRMVETEEEMRKVADVQAEAFHEPVFLFDDVFFEFFKAEVLSGLLYRLRNSPPDRYACLVAEPRNDIENSEKELVGVVDVTAQREDSVLEHLPGAKEYLYVSGIAVLNKFRRQRVATSLLKACDMLSAVWGFDHLVLRAYEDDYGARKLYSKAGYRIVSGDPPWMTTWIGRRRRILMVKQAGKR